MLFLAYVAAASGMYTAPKAIRRDTWIGEEAPQGDAAWAYLVGSVLTIRPDGSVQDCSVSLTSNDPNVDDAICRILKRGARFAPATAPDGTPMYGVFRTWTSWGRTHARDAHDFEINTVELPHNMGLAVRVDIQFLVDAAGRPTQCSDENSDDDPKLVGIACEALPQLMKTAPARTDEGTAVQSVQDATVLFDSKGG